MIILKLSKTELDYIIASVSAAHAHSFLALMKQTASKHTVLNICFGSN